MATIQRPEDSNSPDPENESNDGDDVLEQAKRQLEEERKPKGGFFNFMMGRWFIPVLLYFVGLIVLAATADQSVTHYVSIGVGSVFIILIFVSWYVSGTTASDVKTLKAEKLAREDLELEQRDLERRREALSFRE
jgi:hypothetical protein